MNYSGAVYLLQVGSRYKIGCSKNPERRIRQLQTGSATTILCVHLLPTHYYQQIEKQLHYIFRDKRGIGEWFTLDAEDVAYIKSLNENGRTQQEELQWQRERKVEQTAHDSRMAAKCRDEAREAIALVAAV